MGKTRRYNQRNGEFKKLRSNRKQQNKKERRNNKVNLQKCMEFATKHRAAIDMCQGHVAMYMKVEQESNEVHCCDHTKAYCIQHRGKDGCNIRNSFK